MQLIPMQLVTDEAFEKAQRDGPDVRGMPVLLKSSALWPQPDGEWIVWISRPPSPARLTQMQAPPYRPWWRFW